MALYDFAKGLILEAGNKVRLMMQEELDIKTKSNPNDLVTMWIRRQRIIYMKRFFIIIQIIRLLAKRGMVIISEYLKGLFGLLIQLMEHLILLAKENFAISIGIYHDGKPYAGFVYDVMKDVLYHAKVGQGAFENTHKLEMIQNTELKKVL